MRDAISTIQSFNNNLPQIDVTMATHSIGYWDIQKQLTFLHTCFSPIDPHLILYQERENARKVRRKYHGLSGRIH